MSYKTITDAAAALRSGDVTSTRLVEDAIAVADTCDEATGTFLARFNDSALEAAHEADAALAAERSVGALHGIPLGIKDIITTAEGPSTAQSLVLDPEWSDGDAPVVSRLRGAGGIIMGKLTTMEFAIGLADPEKPFPIPRNPWNLDYFPGGSSSGSGISVSTGSVLGALGTDTGGSIRLPASYCGISGLMPTFGRVPKSGCVPLGYSLDHIGPMARSARDCALMLQSLAGPDSSDPNTIDVPVEHYLDALDGDLTGVRIGVDRLSRIGKDVEDAALPPAFDAAIEVLRARGATIVEIELPFYGEMTAADVVTMLSEALAYHLPDLQSRWGDYNRATRSTIGAGIFYSAADFVQAQRARRVGMKALAEVYRSVDLIVTPTTSGGATSLADSSDLIDGMIEGIGAQIYTPYWDSTGNPVLSVPMGFTETGLPLGLQIAGRPFAEAAVLKAGDALQQETDWHLQVPAIAGAKMGVPA